MGDKEKTRMRITHINSNRSYSLCNDKININFYDKKETFSEYSTLCFVAESYKNSCLLLVEKLEESKNCSVGRIKYLSTLYLPAMFCFRHYLELKLKQLYIWYYGESFITDKDGHKLNKLLKDLQKDENVKFEILSKAIGFIEEHEKFSFNGEKDASYFRYLIDKNFESEKSLTFSLNYIDKIKLYLTELDFRINQIMQNDWLHSILKNNDKNNKKR